MKKFLFLVLASFLLDTEVALAQAQSTIPEFNALCWKKIDCLNTRAKLIDSEKNYKDLIPEDKKIAESGFVPNQDPCVGGKDNDEWGKCLPGSSANTEIAFGGKREFTNLGEFIQSNYIFLISIAGILAAVMIIVAGFQWVTSGGNAETITSAKHRISGALIGLFIAYMSYFILNTISPALVNFRLPQTWMVRSQELVPKFCADAPSTTMFAKVFDETDQKSKVDLSKAVAYDYDKTRMVEHGVCGSRYVIEKGGSTVCYGNACVPGELCTKYNDAGHVGDYNCLQASIIGNITYQSLATAITGCLREGWDTTEITDDGKELELWAVCNNGSSEKVQVYANTVTLRGSQFYRIAASAQALEAAAQECSARGGLAGYVMSHEFNEGCDLFDEDHIIGKNGVDLGINTWEFKRGGIPPNFSLSDSAKVDIAPRKKYFFSMDELKRGMIVNIDAAKVQDVDEDADMNVYKSL